MSDRIELLTLISDLVNSKDPTRKAIGAEVKRLTSALEAQNDRLLKAQGGLGMVSEMNDMQEAAVLVSGLHDRIAEYEKPQPQCGHKARYVVSSKEGTGFCLMCVFEQVSHMMAHRDKILNEINRLAMLPADNSEIKDGESDNPLDILMKVSLLSALRNRSITSGRN